MNEPSGVGKPAWQTEARRVLMGVVWFFVLWFLARIVLGAIVGASAGAHAAGTPSYTNGYNAGQAAALLFFQKYGLLVLLGALATAVAGTLSGFLPGTRRPHAAASYEAPPSGGQWPPPPGSPR